MDTISVITRKDFAAKRNNINITFRLLNDWDVIGAQDEYV